MFKPDGHFRSDLQLPRGTSNASTVRITSRFLSSRCVSTYRDLPSPLSSIALLKFGCAFTAPGIASMTREKFLFRLKMMIAVFVSRQLTYPRS